jgi:hypothetical protein
MDKLAYFGYYNIYKYTIIDVFINPKEAKQGYKYVYKYI